MSSVGHTSPQPSTFADSLSDDRLEALLARWGAPLHVYSVPELQRRALAYKAVAEDLYPRARGCFAVKSNPCQGAVNAFAAVGFGVDAASEYELHAALQAGIPGTKVVCNGNAKTDAYLAAAIEADCLIAVDAPFELHRIDELARDRGAHARVLIRISGLPLRGYTSAAQSTATEWTKFGVTEATMRSMLSEIDRMPAVDAVGISAHIGTQICNPAAFHLLLETMIRIMAEQHAEGRSFSVLDIGGGYPVNFLSREQWEAFQRDLLLQLRGDGRLEGPVTWDNLAMGYGTQAQATAPVWKGKAYWSEFPGPEMLRTILTHEDSRGQSVVDRLHGLGSPELIFEPGRSVMAPAGITLARVMGTKTVQGRPLVALDLGITNHGTNLLAPDMFRAQVRPRGAAGSDDGVFAFLAGRLCFSGDMISRQVVHLNRLPERGEVLLLQDTGAYSADHFASHSCGFPLPGKYAILENGDGEVWREAESTDHVFTPPRHV